MVLCIFTEVGFDQLDESTSFRVEWIAHDIDDLVIYQDVLGNTAEEDGLNSLSHHRT